jgi:hypothetical protein
VEGLSVFVANQSGQPAVNAYVQVYADIAQHATYAGYTDGSGHIVFSDVPAGTYTVVVTSSDDHFLLLDENVEAPGVLSLDTDGTAQVDVYAFGLDGSSPVQAGVLFAPFFTARPDVGWTDTGGHLRVNVTPHTYSVIVASFSEPCFLVKPNVTVDGPLSLDVNPTQMPTGEITPDLLDFASVRIGSWGSHSAWSWNFTLSDGETMAFSPDIYNLDPDLIKSGYGADWYYTVDGGYGSYQVTAGSSGSLSAGGAFMASTMPDSSFYDPGTEAQVDNRFIDGLGNQVVWIEQRVSTAAGSDLHASRDEIELQGPITVDHSTESKRGDLRTTDQWYATCPALTVEDASGQDVVDDVTCAIWIEDYQVGLSVGAVSGVYTETVSVDTGPHQGVVEAEAHFVVGSVFGDLDGDGSVGVEDVQAAGARWRTSSADPDPDDDPGTPNYDPLYDVDKDGQVTVLDVMQVSSQWGQTSP